MATVLGLRGNTLSRNQIVSAIVVIVLAATGPLHGAPVPGTAHVIDGDTIAIGAARVRLHGIDHPETEQRCEQTDGRTWRCDEAAADALASMTEGQQISCDVQDVDTYGRLVAVCHAGGLDVGQVLVADGVVQPSVSELRMKETR